MRYGVMCNVRCVVKYGDAILNDGVIHGEYSGVLMQDVVVEYRYGMVEMQRGVVWNVCCGVVRIVIYI